MNCSDMAFTSRVIRIDQTDETQVTHTHTSTARATAHQTNTETSVPDTLSILVKHIHDFQPLFIKMSSQYLFPVTEVRVRPPFRGILQQWTTSINIS
jgi:hypothetical protein